MIEDLFKKTQCYFEVFGGDNELLFVLIVLYNPHTMSYRNWYLSNGGVSFFKFS